MEKEIIDLMLSNGLNKIKLFDLIDMGNGLDDDLEEYPIVADVIEIRDNVVYIYDEADEDANGVIEPLYRLSDLSDSIKKDVRWALIETLGIICK